MTALPLRAKVLVTAVAVAGSAAVAGLGTYGTFTDTTTTVATPVDSGIVELALGATGAQTNRLDVAAVDIVPGDTIQRSFDLDAATSTSPFGSVTMTSTATTSSLLDTDTTHGLQVKLDRCSVAWSEAGVAPGRTYTCLGTTSAVLASRPVVGSTVALANLGSLATAAALDHVLMTLTLPATADNTFQNKASVVAFSFTATQRAATDK